MASTEGKLDLLGVSRQMRRLPGSLGGGGAKDALAAIQDSPESQCVGTNRRPALPVRLSPPALDGGDSSITDEKWEVSLACRKGVETLRQAFSRRSGRRLAIVAIVRNISYRVVRIKLANPPWALMAEVKKAGRTIKEKVQKMIRGPRNKAPSSVARENRALLLRRRHLRLSRLPWWVVATCFRIRPPLPARLVSPNISYKCS